MKIKVTKDFFDRENDMILRKVGEEIEVSSQRGMYLQSQCLCEITPQAIQDIVTAFWKDPEQNPYCGFRANSKGDLSLAGRHHYAEMRRNCQRCKF